MKTSHPEVKRTHEWAQHFIPEEEIPEPEGINNNQSKDTLSKSVEQCSPQFIENVIPLSKYSFETHPVTTEDGYVLSLFRLRSKTARQNGKVVFLQHGLQNCAGSWLQNGEDKALGFLLAKAGFDVWLGNNRGSKYSRKNLKLSPNDRDFWHFSFDQMAQYDVPANLKYVNQATDSQIIYIGYSQGTTQMFAALSDAKIRPKVAPLIKVFYALAPIVYLDQNKVPVTNYVTYLTNLVKTLAYAVGVDYLNLGTCVWDQAKVDYWNKYCGDSPKKCYKKVFLTDQDPSVDNWPRDGYRELIGSAGASAQSFLHYAQLIKAQIKNSHAFPKYDYGAIKNYAKYGQLTPPNYDLGLVRERVRLWVGTKDTLGTVPEIERIHQDLKNADSDIQMLTNWGHATFNLAKDASYFYQLVDELKSL